MHRPTTFTRLPVPPGGIMPGPEERDHSSPGKTNSTHTDGPETVSSGQDSAIIAQGGG